MNTPVSFRSVAIFACFLILAQTAGAQLNTVPIKRAPASPGKSSGIFRKQADPLKLPFFDDFSFTRTSYGKTDTEAGYPLDSLWEDSDNVWIKSGTEIDAPTVNVATLDGINSVGDAYSNEPLANGSRDTLTSRPIDLSESEVALAERGSVFLSFFYQWRGNGEPPDALDNFRVEFRNVSEQWVTVATISPNNSFESNLFYDTLIKVNGEEFFHEAFQFRFRNFGRLSGPFDTWNLDYIYLDKGIDPDDFSFDDGALASPAGPLFGPYHSIPYEHFLSAPVVGDVNIDVFNLRSNTTNPDPYTYRTTATFTNYDDGVATQNNVTLTEADRPVRPDNPLLGPRERFTIETLADDRPDVADPLQFDPAGDSARIDLKFLLLSNDNGYFRSNDTVSASYILKDYYAYDDGSAEYAVSVNEPDDQVAVRYDIPGMNADTLVAIDVYIPRHNISGFLIGDFFVMDAEDGFPRETISSISQVIVKKDRDAFQRIHLSKPISVQNTFFIGWKGSFTSILFVGKDADNNTADKIYVNPFGSWIENTTVEGSLMIRPVFGKGDPVTDIGDELSRLTVYPNPSKGKFYVSGSPDEIELISMSGRKVQIEISNQDDETEVSVPHNAPGMYILRMRKGNLKMTTRVIIQP
jgi:hypothetical protein